MYIVVNDLPNLFEYFVFNMLFHPGLERNVWTEPVVFLYKINSTDHSR